MHRANSVRHNVDDIAMHRAEPLHCGGNSLLADQSNVYAENLSHAGGFYGPQTKSRTKHFAGSNILEQQVPSPTAATASKSMQAAQKSARPSGRREATDKATGSNAEKHRKTEQTETSGANDASSHLRSYYSDGDFSEVLIRINPDGDEQSNEDRCGESEAQAAQANGRGQSREHSSASSRSKLDQNLLGESKSTTLASSAHRRRSSCSDADEVATSRTKELK